MCGIAGIFGRDGRDSVARMLDTLVHRGPDDGYVVGDESFALGTRRLAILDPADGRQPISNEDGTVWAALNGELYNFPRVRRGLLERGHALHTHCDTELLPHLYEERGGALAEAIDGMFAVAVWDTRARRTVLARDRVGKKPLYYTLYDGALCFASELKALLALPGFSRRLNLDALDHYLSLKHVPHPLTIFDGVAMLPPAHVLTWTEGERPQVSRYWAPRFAPTDDQDDRSDEELADELIAVLGAAVERRFLSDVPIAFFLSGGLDSSLVTALAAERAPKIKTFSLVYAPQATTAGKEADQKWARWVAERFATEHHEEQMTAERFPETLPHVIRAFDEPFSGVTSTFHLARAISRHVKVAISGDGADELFGSYLSHRLALPLAARRGWRAPDGNAPEASGPDRRIVDRLTGLTEAAWRHRLHVFTDADKRDLYSPETARAVASSTEQLLMAEFAEVGATDPLNRVLEAEFRHQLPDQVLAFVDRLSMAHSLEVRAPFLDPDVVNLVGPIAGLRKLPNGRTKHVLKVAAARYFPAAMIERPKEGFVMPTATWLGGLGDWVRDVLSARALARHGLFAPARVQLIVESALAAPGDVASANRLLSLVAFQTWWDLYLA